MIEGFQPLVKADIGEAVAQELVEDVLGRRAWGRIRVLWTTGDGLDGHRTAWALLNAGAQWLDREFGGQTQAALLKNKRLLMGICRHVRA